MMLQLSVLYVLCSSHLEEWQRPEVRLPQH